MSNKFSQETLSWRHFSFLFTVHLHNSDCCSVTTQACRVWKGFFFTRLRIRNSIEKDFSSETQTLQIFWAKLSCLVFALLQSPAWELPDLLLSLLILKTLASLQFLPSSRLRVLSNAISASQNIFSPAKPIHLVDSYSSFRSQFKSPPMFPLPPPQILIIF